MAEYNQVCTFGGVAFKLSDVQANEKAATLKTNIGKTFIEKNIPLLNNKNTVLNVTGVITGLSRTSGQTLSTAIQNDRASLINLDDGFYHAYADGKHSGNFVIYPSTLVFDDSASRAQGEPIKFTCQFISW